MTSVRVAGRGRGKAPGGVSLVLSRGKMSVSSPGRKGEGEELCGPDDAVRNRHSIFFSLPVSLITGWQMLSITVEGDGVRAS